MTFFAIRRCAAVLANGVAVLVGAAGVASSCGYHSSVDLQRGLLNWVFPNALYVRTAVWQAQQANVLPPRATTRDLFAFQKAVSLLERFNAIFQAAAERSHAPPTSAFAMVFIEPMLWSRFALVEETLKVQIHINGPQPGDLVVISDEPVIAAIVAGRLNANDAVEQGLVRLYGDPAASVRWLRVLDRLEIIQQQHERHPRTLLTEHPKTQHHLVPSAHDALGQLEFPDEDRSQTHCSILAHPSDRPHDSRTAIMALAGRDQQSGQPSARALPYCHRPLSTKPGRKVLKSSRCVPATPFIFRSEAR